MQAALGENRLGFVCAIICPRGFTALLVALEPSSRYCLGSRAEFSQRQAFVLLKGLFPPHVCKRLRERSYNLCLSYDELACTAAFHHCSAKAKTYRQSKSLLSFPSSQDQKLLLLMCCRTQESEIPRSKPILNSCQHRLCNSGLPRGSPQPSETPTPAGPKCVRHIRNYLEGRSLAIAH